MKRDPNNHKEQYFAWKERIRECIPEISKTNSELIKQFLTDMERGINIAPGSRKGARSYVRLKTLKDKLIFFSKHFKKQFNIDIITGITEEQLCTFFADMRNGTIRKKDGQIYMSVYYYVKVFKTFWHSYMKAQKKKGKIILDITTDLDTTSEKPKWVYLSEEQIKKLCNNAKYGYKVLMMLLFDSGIRSPTELANLRVSDFYEDYKKLVIREEISKTFGRKINLMLCPGLIKEYIKEKDLKETDYLFTISPQAVNRYLRRLSKRILGEVRSLAGEKYSNLSMYDFRHSSACYWLSRYKSESALKYRFGWKKSEMIHYYTEFLGMKDTICEEDMLVDVTKTEIEKRLDQTEKDKQLMQDKIDSMEQQMIKIAELTNTILSKVG